MAYEEKLETITLKAPSTAFSTRQYYAVCASSSEGYFKAGSTGAGAVVGILQDAPTLAGEPCKIGIGGVSKAYAGTNGISANDVVVSGANGTVRSSTAFSGNFAQAHLFGICLQAASSGVIGSVLLKSVGRTT